MSLVEVMKAVIDQEITEETIVEETDKIEILEIIAETKEETIGPESNLLYKAMPLAQQDLFLMFLLTIFWYSFFYLETCKRQENH